MNPTEISNQRQRPRVTVAALIEHEGRLLCVEEKDDAQRLVINQPAGHVEAGESPIAAWHREVFEETGWHCRPEYLVGIYSWARPDGSINYLRLAIAGHAERLEPDARLDDGILRAVWLLPAELAAERARHRSPLVMRCVEDYLAGERYPLTVIKSLG